MAQESRPAFDVASVKRNLLGAPGPGGGPTALGQFRPDGLSYTNQTLTMLIRAAYQIRDEWIIGGPEWARTHRFDVIAKASREVSRDELRLMMQSLLEERFRLVVVTEKRERPAYVLRMNRADGRLGSDLRKAADDCNLNRPTDPAAIIARQPRPSSGARPSFGGACTPIASVAASLQRTLRTDVIDETGLAGRWDYVVAHSGLQPDTTPTGPDGTVDTRPSLFAALEEQLGLKLERQRRPVDVLVVESVQPPTEN